MKGDQETIKLVTANAKWFQSLMELAEKAKSERIKYEAVTIENRTLPQFQKLNHAIAELAGYASSAKGILRDNDIDPHQPRRVQGH